jgi:hypothetical protein
MKIKKSELKQLVESVVQEQLTGAPINPSIQKLNEHLMEAILAGRKAWDTEQDVEVRRRISTIYKLLMQAEKEMSHFDFE